MLYSDVDDEQLQDIDVDELLEQLDELQEEVLQDLNLDITLSTSSRELRYST